MARRWSWRPPAFKGPVNGKRVYRLMKKHGLLLGVLVIFVQKVTLSKFSILLEMHLREGASTPEPESRRGAVKSLKFYAYGGGVLRFTLPLAWLRGAWLLRSHAIYPINARQCGDREMVQTLAITSATLIIPALAIRRVADYLRNQADRRVALAPLGLKRLEFGCGRLGGFGPVDRLQIRHDELAASTRQMPASCGSRDQVNDARSAPWSAETLW